MKQRITAFWNRWSPWHLRKVIRNLDNNFKESKRRCEVTFNEKEALRFQCNSLEADYNECKRLLDKKEDLTSEANRHVLAENERLEKENDILKNAITDNKQLWNKFVNASIENHNACVSVINKMKGETNEQK